MQATVIKKLIESISIQDLKEAEEKICQNERPNFEVEGDNEKEQLTHILAAIHILEMAENDKIGLNIAFRRFFERVRTSIS